MSTAEASALDIGAHCKSCPASVFWAETDRGKLMLVDAEPVRGGNLRLVDRPGRRPFVSVVPQRFAFGAVLYLAHFASCPKAAEHRQRRERVAP